MEESNVAEEIDLPTEEPSPSIGEEGLSTAEKEGLSTAEEEVPQGMPSESPPEQVVSVEVDTLFPEEEKDTPKEDISDSSLPPQEDESYAAPLPKEDEKYAAEGSLVEDTDAYGEGYEEEGFEGEELYENWSPLRADSLLRAARAGLVGAVQVIIQGGEPSFGMASEIAAKGDQKEEVEDPTDGWWYPMDIDGARGSLFQTAMHLVATGGTEPHLKLMTILVQGGANVNARDNDARTPLHHAAMAGNIDATRRLIALGGHVDVLDRSQMTPLHLAAIRGHTPLIILLLEAEGGRRLLDVPSSFGYTPLHRAVVRCHTSTVRKLLDEGANLYAKDQMGRSVVHVASQVRGNGAEQAAARAGLVKMLVQALVDQVPHKEDDQRMGSDGLSDGERALLDTILVPNAVQANPFHGAASAGAQRTLHVLIEKVEQVCGKPGVVMAVNMEDSLCQRPLHHAAEHGWPEVVSLLVANGAQLEATDVARRTALHCAASEGHGAVVDVLVSLLEENKSSSTPWLQRGLSSSKLLNRPSADAPPVGGINRRDRLGRTPLSTAVVGGHVGVVRLLLTKDARVDIADSAGKTALHLACAYEKEDISRRMVAELLGHAANPLTQAKSGESPLHAACYVGYTSVAKLVLSAAKYVGGREQEQAVSTAMGLKDNIGRTPLDLAKSVGHKELVEWMEHSIE